MTLKEFHRDKQALKEVHDYLVQSLVTAGVEKMFAKESVAHIAEAREVIDQAFSNLDVMFGSKTKAKKHTTNEAR